MDLFQKTYSEALEKNKSETKKWETHLEELRQTESNLKEFQKKLQIDCMVPIGTKALMPGYLYHTSEILVGNGSKLFSKCTTFDALKICKHRQKYAEERLEALKTETDLYKNKLELPFMENAFGNQGQEIIEEYDEEKEREWREKHRRSVANQKEKERMERENAGKEKSHEEIINLLDELELMDELESELDSMDIQSDDQLRRLMSGEIKPPPEKKRVSHFSQKKSNVIVDGSVKPQVEENIEMKNENQNETAEIVTQNQPILPQIQENEPPIIVPETDSPPDEGNYTGESESDTESDIDSTTVSEQVWSKCKTMLEEMKKLSRKEKRRYLKQKMKDLQISLRELVVHDVDTLTVRIDLNDLKDLIEDEIFRLDGNEKENTEENQNEIKQVFSKPEKKQKSTKISFAREDDVKLIDKYEAPCKVSAVQNELPVEKLLESHLTRQIKFTHSEWPVMEPCKENEDEIASPSDIYGEKFGYIQKPKPEIQNCDLPSSRETSNDDLKSILKNKEKVLQETRVKPPLIEKRAKKEKRVRNIKHVEIIGEVIERPVDYESKPKSKPVSSDQNNEPKISKFKANRINKTNK
uniref:CSON002494 protein n=1 Tax=Culicoides sonorensis TaxID=179676 RepID=A0A336L1K1_CULSO